MRLKIDTDAPITSALKPYSSTGMYSSGHPAVQVGRYSTPVYSDTRPNFHLGADYIFTLRWLSYFGSTWYPTRALLR